MDTNTRRCDICGSADLTTRYLIDGKMLCGPCYWTRDYMAIPGPTPTTPEPDAVVHPSHYAKGGVECIAAIKASMTPEAYKGYLKGNTLKYLWRYESKGKPQQDLEKAVVYLGWLLDVVKGEIAE